MKENKKNNKKTEAEDVTISEMVKHQVNNDKKLKVEWNSATDKGKCWLCDKEYRKPIGYCFYTKKDKDVCFKCAEKDIAAIAIFYKLKYEHIKESLPHDITREKLFLKCNTKRKRKELIRELEGVIYKFLDYDSIQKIDIFGALELTKYRFFDYNRRKHELQYIQPDVQV